MNDIRNNESRSYMGQRYEVWARKALTGEPFVYGYTNNPTGEPYMTEIAQAEGIHSPHVFNRDLYTSNAGNTGVLSEPDKPISEEQLEKLDSFQPTHDAAGNAKLAEYFRLIADELVRDRPRLHVKVEHLPNVSSPITLLMISRLGTVRLTHDEHQKLFVP